jgi:AcrR family transcriptional regulator
MKPRDPEKEQALFDAALRVAERESLDTLTMQKVAFEAGLAVGTVYVYFDGKQDLLRRLYLKTKAAAGPRLLEGLTPDLPFRQATRLLCRNHFDFLVDHRLEIGFQEKFYHSSWMDGETQALSQVYLEPIFALIHRGQSEELVKPWDPVTLLRLILAVTHEAAIQAVGVSDAERLEIADRAAAFILDGIAL